MVIVKFIEEIIIKIVRILVMDIRINVIIPIIMVIGINLDQLDDDDVHSDVVGIDVRKGIMVKSEDVAYDDVGIIILS
jgi:hypothetical protein